MYSCRAIYFRVKDQFKNLVGEKESDRDMFPTQGAVSKLIFSIFLSFAS